MFGADISGVGEWLRAAFGTPWGYTMGGGGARGGCLRNPARVEFSRSLGLESIRAKEYVQGVGECSRSSAIMLEIDSKRHGRVYESHIGQPRSYWVVMRLVS